MKQLLIILITILITSVSYAGPYFVVEHGVMTFDRNLSYNKGVIGYRYSFMNGWIVPEVWGGWTTWSDLVDPFEDIYSIGAKLSVKAFYIKWDHYCAHTVQSGYNTTENEEGEQVFTEYRVTPNQWGGNYQTVSVGFEYEFK